MSPPINIDGSQVSGITIDGTSVSEVTVDGDVVFSAIPDNVVSLYEYENDSDTTTALDSKGSNDANISGATYTTSANVGSLALDHDRTDFTQSQNTVDLVAGGDTNGMSLSCWVNVQSITGDTFNHLAEIGIDGDANNNFSLIIDENNNYASFLQVGGTNSVAVSNTKVDVNNDGWVHMYNELQADGTHIIKIDGTQEGSASSGLDPTNIGNASLVTGTRLGTAGGKSETIIDDYAPANDPLTDSELDELIRRA